MKKGVLTITILALVGFLFIAVGVLTAADAPDTIKIENSGYKKDKKGPVTLSHAKHVVDYKAVCTDCHHDYKDGKNVWKEGDAVKKCSECHEPEGKSKDKPEGLRYAFHDNCQDCHDTAIKAGNKNAPKKTKCTACHAKE